MSSDSEEVIAREVMRSCIANAPRDKKTGVALAEWIAASIERRGLILARAEDVMEPPDHHLRMLKDIRKRINDALDSDNIHAREVASLTRRLSETSREIVDIEERHKAEAANQGRRNSGTNSVQSGTAPRASKTGALDI